MKIGWLSSAGPVYKVGRAAEGARGVRGEGFGRVSGSRCHVQGLWGGRREGGELLAASPLSPSACCITTLPVRLFDWQAVAQGAAARRGGASLHYGEEVVAGLMGLPHTHADVHKVYLAVYRSFMEALDAIDNGVNQFESEHPPRYVNNTHLSARVGRFNPDWLDDASPAAQDAAFHKAMALAGEEFVEVAICLVVHTLPHSTTPPPPVPSTSPPGGDVHGARLAGSFETSQNPNPLHHQPPGRRRCEEGWSGVQQQWKGHLSELEGELKLNPLPKYMLYEDDRAKQWRVQAISVAPGSFESRCPLPVDWRGLRDDELSERSSIPRGVFVHMSGFIGGNHTYEGALAMAKAGHPSSALVLMRDGAQDRPTVVLPCAVPTHQRVAIPSSNHPVRTALAACHCTALCAATTLPSIPYTATHSVLLLAHDALAAGGTGHCCAVPCACCPDAASWGGGQWAESAAACGGAAAHTLSTSSACFRMLNVQRRKDFNGGHFQPLDVTDGADMLIRILVPTYQCPGEERLGVWGDGGKWTCMLPSTIQPKPIVYSIGSNESFSFESEISQELHIRTDTFDPFIPPEAQARMKALPFLRFHSIGVASSADINEYKKWYPKMHLRQLAHVMHVLRCLKTLSLHPPTYADEVHVGKRDHEAAPAPSAPLSSLCSPFPPSAPLSSLCSPFPPSAPLSSLCSPFLPLLPLSFPPSAPPFLPLLPLSSLYSPFPPSTPPFLPLLPLSSLYSPFPPSTPPFLPLLPLSSSAPLLLLCSLFPPSASLSSSAPNVSRSPTRPAPHVEQKRVMRVGEIMRGVYIHVLKADCQGCEECVRRGEGGLDKRFMRLNEIMKRLGHSYIDVLKVDCEGCEEHFIQELVAANHNKMGALTIHGGRLPFGQMLCEFHRWGAVRLEWFVHAWSRQA
ncbi:unnamed protein product [Closterium sp. NIES-65]|nr:unnamed protein product [Closterium sp. NIES-65]